MTRVWFNRTFSHVRGALELIRAGDAHGRFSTLCTHPNPHFTGFLAADASELERLRAQRHAPRHWAHPPLLAGEAVRTSHAE